MTPPTAPVPGQGRTPDPAPVPSSGLSPGPAVRPSPGRAPDGAGGSRRPRVVWSLRTTLTLTIAGLFILATGTVLTVQTLVTTRALDQQVQTIGIGNAPGGGSVGTDPGLTDPGLTEPAPADEAEVCASDDTGTSTPCTAPTLTPGQDGVAGPSAARREVTTLRDAVISTTVTSSVLIFAAFSALALLIAWFVATGTTRRITAITALADALDPDDPSGRIRAPSRSDEIGQLTDTLNGALDRIEDAISSQKQFIANASHELLTPIAAIETSLDAPLSQGRFPEDVRPAVHRALAANRKSANLVRSLLQLARAQGQPRTVHEPVDLAALAGRVVQDLRERLDERRLDVDTGALHPVTVDADPVLLELAVRNLVDNAVTHNVDGGRLGLATSSAGGAATLAVTNSTATTAAPGDVALLVQPFHRGDATRLGGAPGFGVGLAVVDAVVRAHGARLDLARPSTSTFRATLSLPTCPPDPDAGDRLAGQSARWKQGRVG
ncbi:HAMP domain-containing sensor histidine kinase [Cellulomonas cellasea]|uniref:histidine kinase n=1 Tax=Cellulomonas cellasea TaxID=43670 RepID=A0A7W4YCP0_9CELL|nr:HAMP domain-containing sensor histidine kinase [Cellulomonas cellasea]MBB2923726.1 signal transduction histidine kinase [Cellulomonas cellasea]